MNQHLIDYAETLSTNALFRQLPALIFVRDFDNGFVTGNDKCAQLLGYKSPEDLTLRDYGDIRGPAREFAERFNAEDQEVLNDKSTQHYLGIYTFSDGNTHVLYTIKKPLYFETDKVEGLLCQAMDLDPSLLANFDNSILSLGKNNSKYEYTYRISDCLPKYDLSERESEVLFYLLRGYSYKMISAELSRSIRTIETHIYNIRTKLNCTSIDQVIEKAHAEGFSNIIPSRIIKSFSPIS